MRNCLSQLVHLFFMIECLCVSGIVNNDKLYDPMHFFFCFRSKAALEVEKNKEKNVAVHEKVSLCSFIIIQIKSLNRILDT